MMNAWKNFAGARRCGNRREKKKEETAEKTRNINPAHTKTASPQEDAAFGAGGRLTWKSAAAEAAISAAAEEQEDDNPAEISSESAATAAAVMFETAVVIASSAAAAQDQDQENQITAAVSSRLALASATAVCCRNITHMNSSKIFFTLHHMKRSLP